VEEGAPAGGEDNYVVLKEVGRRRDFDQEGFAPKSHDELGELLGIIDTARGAKVSGARFYYLVGAGARLELALLKHALDLAVQLGFTPMITPSLVRPDVMRGTGFLGEHAAEVYHLPADDLYLTGTSEVALAGYHKDEIVDLAAGPLRYAGWSACYRREAGSHGKDTKGIFRVHQFHKVELFSYVDPAAAHAEQLLARPPPPEAVALVRALGALPPAGVPLAAAAAHFVAAPAGDPYGEFLLDWAQQAPEFGAALAAAAVDVEGGVERAVALLARLPDGDAKHDAAAEVALRVGDRADALLLSERDLVMDGLVGMLRGSEFEWAQVWGAIVFAEIAALPELVCPSAKEFFVEYARCEESVVAANVALFGEEFMREDGELRRAVSFLAALFEANEGAREMFLARYGVSDEVIADWPEDLADKMPLFLPDPAPGEQA
jgi:hypothetical protein